MNTQVRQGRAIEVAGLEIVPLEQTDVGGSVQGQVVTGFAAKRPVGVIVRGPSFERVWRFDLD